jgi:hypothetical protein
MSFPPKRPTDSVEPMLAACKPKIFRCFYYPAPVRVKDKYTYIIALRTYVLTEGDAAQVRDRPERLAHPICEG